MSADDLGPSARDAVQSLAAMRGACPEAAELVAYEALDGARRAAHPIHDHVQVCSRCQLVLLTLEEPAAQPSATRRWMLPLAAAVALAVLGPLLFQTLRAPESPIDTVRGIEIQPIAPVGAVNGAPRFEWQSPIQAAKYRLTVYRGQAIAWQGDTTTTRLEPPATLRVEPGIEYTWQVEALDAEGSVRMSSPRTAFTVR